MLNRLLPLIIRDYCWTLFPLEKIKQRSLSGNCLQTIQHKKLLNVINRLATETFGLWAAKTASKNQTGSREEANGRQ